MAYNYFQLNNGIRVIHKQVDTSISHVGIVVNTGTRDELQGESGIAHFIEHAIFKGTAKRNTYQVLSYLENVGGELNAYTTKEETFFYASVLNAYLQRAVDLLSDIVFNSTFCEKELEKEKEVVKEEIKLCKDTPSEWIFDEFEDIVFNGHSLGTNILGSIASLKKINRKGILQFVNRTYTTDQIVVAVVGNVAMPELKKILNKYLAYLPEQHRTFQRQAFTGYHPSVKTIKLHSNQSHIVIGCALPAYNDRQCQVAALLSNILGGQGLNSRLNMAIREKKGYVYNIEANYTALSDAGLFNVYIGCDHKNQDKCIELTLKEIRKIQKSKLGTLQLRRAHLQMIGQMCITYDSNLNEMLSIGKNHLLFHEVDTVEDMVKTIQSITADELSDMADTMLNIDNFTYLIMGK
ncbi:MAG: insulinase family protein [Bacteroidales bacterium]|nr:insulinase family protein [Bacteroidales bacterium]